MKNNNFTLDKKQKRILTTFMLVVFLGGSLYGFGLYKLKLRIDDLTAKHTYTQTYQASKELNKESTQQMLTKLKAEWKTEHGDQRIPKNVKIER